MILFLYTSIFFLRFVSQKLIVKKIISNFFSKLMFETAKIYKIQSGEPDPEGH